jgi:HK97 family phage major capsid protein
MPLDGTEKELIEAAAAYKKAADEVKAQAEKATTEIKALGNVTAETKTAADKALSEMNGINGRLSELEQKLARRGAGGDAPMERKSLGQQAIEHEAFKEVMARGRGRASIEVKAITSGLTTDAMGSAGDLIVTDRRPGVLAMPERAMTVRGLLMPGETNSNSIQYVKETGFTNAAATVSETTGALKPQSDVKFDVVNAAVTTIAHWVLATKQVLDDAPQLRSIIDGRLRYGYRFVEEAQLLMGAGTGTDLNGIYTQAVAYAAPGGLVAANFIDQLRLALLQASLAEFPATGIVLNPIDFARIDLMKDTAGQYIFAQPQGGVTQRRLWALPVAETQAMTQDKFLVGAFQMAAQIFDREELNVEISTEDSDNFRKNLVTIRAEGRIGLAVYRPEGMVKGDLGFVA